MKIKPAGLEILMKIKCFGNALALVMVGRSRGGVLPHMKGLQQYKTKSCVCFFVEVQNIHVTFPTNDGATVSTSSCSYILQIKG